MIRQLLIIDMNFLVLCLFSTIIYCTDVVGKKRPDEVFGRGTRVTAREMDRIRVAYEKLSKSEAVKHNMQGTGRPKFVSNRAPVKGKPNPNATLEELNEKALPYLFQTDILLTAEQAESLLEDGHPRMKRGTQTNPNGFWTPGTPIPYYFDSSITSTVRASIIQGIQFWQNNTCLSFTQSSTANNRLRFFAGSGCYSSIGKQWTQSSQDVSIGNGCNGFGTVTHEIGHALGFFHTQSRPDRDSYVFVNYSNISPDLAYNFVKNAASQDNPQGLAYDYGSVMQYNPYAFAINVNVPSISALNPANQNAMGQREGPAFSDVKTMNLAYKCTGPTNCGTKVTCQNNGIPHPKLCGQCLCPQYYTGNDCSKLKTGNAPICNGQVLQASSTWQNFAASVGQNNYLANQNPTDCYWQIQAPAGRKVQLKLVSTPQNCMDGCVWQAIDINVGQPDLYGMLVCCPSAIGTVWSTPQAGQAIAVRGLARYNIANFTMAYQYV